MISVIIVVLTILNPLNIYSFHKISSLQAERFKITMQAIEDTKLSNILNGGRSDSSYEKRFKEITEKSNARLEKTQQINSQIQKYRNLLTIGIISSLLFYFVFVYLVTGIILLLPASSNNHNLRLKSTYTKTKKYRLKIFSSLAILSVLRNL